MRDGFLEGETLRSALWFKTHQSKYITCLITLPFLFVLTTDSTKRHVLEAYKIKNVSRAQNRHPPLKFSVCIQFSSLLSSPIHWMTDRSFWEPMQRRLRLSEKCQVHFSGGCLFPFPQEASKMSCNSSKLSMSWMKPSGMLAGAAFSCLRALEQYSGQMWLFLDGSSALQLWARAGLQGRASRLPEEGGEVRGAVGHASKSLSSSSVSGCRPGKHVA